MKNIIKVCAIVMVLSSPIRAVELSVTDKNGIVQVIKGLQSFTMFVDQKAVVLYSGDSQDRLFGSNDDYITKSSMMWGCSIYLACLLAYQAYTHVTTPVVNNK